MTKIEKYDALKEKGVELKHINNHSSDEIDALYKQYFDTEGTGTPTPPEQTGSDGDNNTGTTPPESHGSDQDNNSGNKPPEGPKEKVPAKMVLEFATSGWCEELKMSYRKGVYHPKSKKEYEALKKYAIQEK